jgi:hypothetical protein
MVNIPSVVGVKKRIVLCGRRNEIILIDQMRGGAMAENGYGTVGEGRSSSQVKISSTRQTFYDIAHVR